MNDIHLFQVCSHITQIHTLKMKGEICGEYMSYPNTVIDLNRVLSLCCALNERKMRIHDISLKFD